MQETAYLSALAGLLHDVGKFAVRAGELGSRTWDDEGRRDYGYYHALLTADFIERYVPAAWRVAAKVAAGNHHRPQGPGDRVVTIADRLSAGERADVTEDARAAQPRQLLSIFCSATADGLSAPGDAYWPLVPLRVNRATLFPGPAGNDEAAWGAYRRLWDDFTREAGQLRDAHSAAPDLPVYVESLLLLMQRYTWCMPSAYYRKRPDISLYDHNRTTAALAAVLSDAGFGDDQLSRLAREPEAAGETLALLVGGDLSGVQDFIYTISARGAASALRGRSFYLQMLGEAVARYILRRLDLPATNLIYAGGGNFYLLVRPGDRERLAAAQRAISRVMLGHHRGDLYLALAARPLAGRDFFEGRISGVWSALGEELQRAKQQRFAELGPSWQTSSRRKATAATRKASARCAAARIRA